MPNGPGDQAVAAGCPMCGSSMKEAANVRFMENQAEWPQSCSQDIVYPVLVAA